MRTFAALLIALVVELFTAAPVQATCTGNCNHDSEVTVDELLTMVNMALGTADLSNCAAGDANNDGAITVDEILAAVRSALLGCLEPTPTPSLPPTATPRPPTPTPPSLGPAASKACSDDCQAAQRKCGAERFSEEYPSVDQCILECVSELEDFARDAPDFTRCEDAQVRYIQCCTAKARCGGIPNGCDFVGTANACGGSFGGCPLIFF